MGYYELAREARLKLTSLKKRRGLGLNDDLKEGDAALEGEIVVWEARLQELGVRVASALIEMEDLEGARGFLSTLSASPSPPPPTSNTVTSGLDTRKALLFLCIGDVEAARACVASSASSQSEESKTILALAHMADSDFSAAVVVWEELIASLPSPVETALHRQNLAVCLLYLGRMNDVRLILPFFFILPFLMASYHTILEYK